MSTNITVDHLSTTFSALADPTWRAMLAHLAKGKVSVNELATPFAISLSAVSKHIKVLEKLGWSLKGVARSGAPAVLTLNSSKWRWTGSVNTNSFEKSDWTAWIPIYSLCNKTQTPISNPPKES